LLFGFRLLFAQDVKFTASVSKNEVCIGEQFQVNFKVNGDTAAFLAPNFRDFKVLSGADESTSMVSINGKTTVSKSYTYTLVGLKEGRFTIDPAILVVGENRSLITREIKIKVIKAPAGLQQQYTAQQVIKTNAEIAPGTTSDRKFTTSVSRNEAGTGDVFKITFVVNGSGDNFVPPDFKGFQVVDGPNESKNVESIQGKTSSETSYTYDLKATTDGEFIIGPASVEVEGLRLTSAPVQINIKKGILQLKK